MIPRSKSAPKALSDLAPLAPSSRPKLPRTRTALNLSTATPLASPREAREDPFNLAGFFPSCPTESQVRGEDWDWLRASEVAKEEPEDEYENEDEYYPDFSVPPTPGGTEDKEVEASYDEFARQVIDGEDKFGMLAFSSENFPSLLRSKMPMFERPLSPVHVSTLVVDEPLDLDGVHRKLCSRRQALDTEETERWPPIGQLFFSAEEEKVDESSWSKLLFARLSALVGGISSRL